MSLYIQSLERNITIVKRTRKLSCQINDALFKGVAIKADPTGASAAIADLQIPFANMQTSENIMVKGLASLTDEDFDKLTDEEFLAIKKHIEEVETEQKKSEPTA